MNLRSREKDALTEFQVGKSLRFTVAGGVLSAPIAPCTDFLYGGDPMGASWRIRVINIARQDKRYTIVKSQVKPLS